MMDDEALTQAAAQAAALLNDSLPQPEDCCHEFSPHFRRQMQQLLFRQNHLALFRCLKSAAIILLTLTVLFASLLAVSTEAREFVFGWMKVRMENIHHFYYEGTPTQENYAEYFLGWIPDGYTLVSTFDPPGGRCYTYVDNERAWNLRFIYSTDSSGADIYVVNADCIQKTVSINGLPGTLYIPPTEERSPDLIWTDSKTGIFFLITAHVSEDVLIKMAENITVKK